MLTFAAKAPDVSTVRTMLAHIPGAAEKAVSRALNAALAKAKSEVLRGAKERYTVSPAEFNRGVKLLKASPKRLRAAMLVRGAPLRIIKFKVKSKPTLSEVVRSQVKQWPHGFIAKVGSHVGLFVRTGVWTKSERTKTKESSIGVSRSRVGASLMREKIREITTVSAAQMAGYYEIIEATLVLAGEKLEHELARQVDLFLSGKVS